MKAIVCNKCLACVTDLKTTFAVKVAQTIERDPPETKGDGTSPQWFHLCAPCAGLFAKWMRTKEPTP